MYTYLANRWTNLEIFVKIANRAQDQISSQISQESSDKIKELFEEGVKNVSALEDSVKIEDNSSAKENFLSAMKIFSEISREITRENSVSEFLGDEFSQTESFHTCLPGGRSLLHK